MVFDELMALDLGKYIEKKEGLSYVSWANAWAEVKKRVPDATYTIWKDEKGLPYVYDPLTGYMVYTTVTIEGITHEMWLPVMDSKNKAMKSEPYEYTTKYGSKEVAAATMFDINKTIMRCLVKNLAMHGLGLYIYAGEDLPQGEEEASAPQSNEIEEARLRAKVIKYVNDAKMSKENIEKLCKCYKKKSLQELTATDCSHYLSVLKQKGIEVNE